MKTKKLPDLSATAAAKAIRTAKWATGLLHRCAAVQEFKVTDLNTFKTLKPFNRFTRFKTLEEENTDSMVLSVPAVAELKQFQS